MAIIELAQIDLVNLIEKRNVRKILRKLNIKINTCEESNKLSPIF